MSIRRAAQFLVALVMTVGGVSSVQAVQTFDFTFQGELAYQGAEGFIFGSFSGNGRIVTADGGDGTYRGADLLWISAGGPVVWPGSLANQGSLPRGYSLITDGSIRQGGLGLPIVPFATISDGRVVSAFGGMYFFGGDDQFGHIYAGVQGDGQFFVQLNDYRGIAVGGYVTGPAVVAVPEPETYALLLVGLVVIAGRNSKRRSASQLD